jgi:hypothetical protein
MIACTLTVIMLLVGGCASQNGFIRESAIAWRSPSEIVQLQGPSCVGDHCSRHFMDSSLRVDVALSKHAPSSQSSQCQIIAYVEVMSILTVGKLRLDEEMVYLRKGDSPDRILATSKSGTEDWNKPFLGADGIFYFDIGRVDTIQPQPGPFVIYLDSVMTFNNQVIDLGRIEFSGCSPDSARYVY